MRISMNSKQNLYRNFICDNFSLMKVTLTITKESRILKKDLDIDGMVKAMFKRANRVGEDDIRF